jgi:ATP-binding cassette subfamily B protein
VLNLLTRFHDPRRGAVRIDGYDLRTVTQESWRSQVAVVFQESFLFNTTIRENIRMGRPAASDAEVVEAAKAAEIHDIVERMPDKYDTLAGERGGRLSGGQKQRVAIARALLRDPPVLMLDEATSALDAGAEAAINATLDRAGKGRTVITVTHRLASVVNTDRVFVLDHGRLVEEGSHRELVQQGGIYQRLWEKQSGFTLSPDAMHAQVQAERLKAIPLLGSLDDAALAKLSNLFFTERFAAGRAVFVEGDPGDKFYVIVRGSVVMTIKTASGEERQVGVIQDGNYFGEIALLEDRPRNATIRTRSECLFLTLQREHFLRLLDETPRVRVAFEEVARERLKRRSEIVAAEELPTV